MAQLLKNLPVMRETWVQSLGWEDPLEEGMATHSNILARRIPMVGGAWWATVHGVSKFWSLRVHFAGPENFKAGNTEEVPQTTIS